MPDAKFLDTLTDSGSDARVIEHSKSDKVSEEYRRKMTKILDNDPVSNGSGAVEGNIIRVENYRNGRRETTHALVAPS